MAGLKQEKEISSGGSLIGTERTANHKRVISAYPLRIEFIDNRKTPARQDSSSGWRCSQYCESLTPMTTDTWKRQQNSRSNVCSVFRMLPMAIFTNSASKQRITA